MKFESPKHPSPPIHPNIEAATARFFPRLVRVIVEACPEGTRCYRKLNALEVELAQRDRTSQAEEEVNAAIMSVAEVCASETDEPTVFRAKYMCVDDDGEEEKRRYVTFRLAEREQEVVAKRDDSEPPRWLGVLLEGAAAREQVLIDYNVTLTDRLLDLASQAEPLLRVQENAAKVYEQAMMMAFQSAITQGTAIGAQQMLPETSKEEGDEFSETVLKPGLEMALWQFMNRGSKVPPGPPPGFPGSPTAPPGPASPAPEGVGVPSSGPSRAQAPSTKSSAAPEDSGAQAVNAEVVDALVRTVAMWLGSMDGTQTLSLMAMLSPEQTRSLQAVGAAKNDDDAAKAVLQFKAGLLKGGKGLEMLTLLDPVQKDVLVRIQAMAQQQVEPAAE